MMATKLRILFVLYVVLLLAGCAHSVSIVPEKIDLSERYKYDIKVGYVISQEEISRDVITPGGGGDRVKYKPYQALDAALKMGLEEVFLDAVRLESISKISSYPELLLVFDPKIVRTDSSSSSLFTWPPEQFTIELECYLYDRDRQQLQHVESVGHGTSTRSDWGSFGNFTFGIAGSRAMQNVVEDLFAKIDGRLVAQTIESQGYFASVKEQGRTTYYPKSGQIDPEIVGSGRNYAVVIGNNHYSDFPQLQTADADALSVSKCLSIEYGYEVQTIRNGTRQDILKTLDQIRSKLGIHDNLLIYYAGHGYFDQKAERGYWLPVDARPDTKANWISNADITDSLKTLDARHVMVVADSCYSGTLTRGVNVTVRNPDYFEKMAAMRSRTVLTSGGMEPVADGSGGSLHSVFAKAFLDALEQNPGTMDGTELFTKIRRPVMLNSDQTPEYSDIRKAGHEGGDFLFIRK
jgi:hypothetical protein